MPILGYLILFNDKLNNAGFLSISHAFAPDAWFKLRLYLLYFGFWATAIGVVLFQLRCPGQIKQHGALWEYIDHEASTVGTAQLEGIRHIVISWMYFDALRTLNIDPELTYATLKDRRWNNVGHLFTVINAPITPAAQRVVLEMDSKMTSYLDGGTGTTNLLTNYYDGILRFAFPKIRRTIFAMYTVGLVAIGLPAVELLVRVSISFVTFALAALET